MPYLDAFIKTIIVGVILFIIYLLIVEVVSYFGAPDIIRLASALVLALIFIANTLRNFGIKI